MWSEDVSEEEAKFVKIPERIELFSFFDFVFKLKYG